MSKVNEQYKNCCSYAQQFEKKFEELDITTLLKEQCDQVNDVNFFL